MVVIIDNNSIFTYSLYNKIGIYNENVVIINEFNIEKLKEINPSYIILCCKIDNKEFLSNLINNFSKKAAILSIYYGFHSLFDFLGGNFYQSDNIDYGKKRQIHIANGAKIFKGLPPLIDVGVYNSIYLNRLDLKDEFQIIAEDNNNEIMAVKYRDCEMYGVNFNIESILTECSNIIIKNFLSIKVNNDRKSN